MGSIHIPAIELLGSAVIRILAAYMLFYALTHFASRATVRHTLWLADRELACDMAVMELRHGRRQDYALCLTRMARRQVLGFPVEPPNDLALLNSFLTFRVKTLLAERRRRGPVVQAMATVASAGALFLFAAGWPSLTLAVKLEVAAPPVMAAARSVVIQPSARRMGMPRQRAAVHPEADAPQLSGKVPELDEAVAQPAVFRYSPVDPSLDGGTSGESESDAMGKRSRTPGNDPSAPTPGQSGPSWKKTASAAAIAALGRVAAGRREGDGGGDADDRTSKP